MPERNLAIPSLEDIRRILGNDTPAGPAPAAPDRAAPKPADPMENDDD
ncbi:MULTISPECIES: hypothetical protein [unclassified Luteimonas]